MLLQADEYRLPMIMTQFELVNTFKELEHEFATLLDEKFGFLNAQTKIDTATGDGLKKFERIVGIASDETLSDEERRLRIKTRMISPEYHDIDRFSWALDWFCYENKYVALTNVNVRKRPSIGADIVGTVKAGKFIDVQETKKVTTRTWAKISTGWVDISGFEKDSDIQYIIDRANKKITAQIYFPSKKMQSWVKEYAIAFCPLGWEFDSTIIYRDYESVKEYTYDFLSRYTWKQIKEYKGDIT